MVINKVKVKAADNKAAGKEADKVVDVAMVVAAKVEVEAVADKVANPEEAATRIQMENSISANTQLN